MSYTPTHPYDAWSPAKVTKAVFQSLLLSALHNYYEPSKNKYYQSGYGVVRVLTTCWDWDTRDGLNIGNLPQRVGSIFEKMYNYDWENYNIAAMDPNAQGAFEGILRQAVDGLGKRDLLIFYYVGLGAPANGSLCFFPSFFNSNRPNLNGVSVDFLAARKKILDPAEPDVLMLLDTCHSGAGATLGAHKEMIAASAFKAVSYDGPRSFTANMAQEIADVASKKQVITAPQLYSRLATRKLALGVDGQPLLSSTPVHLQNYPHPRTPIYLAPHVDEGETDAAAAARSRWVTASHKFIAAEPVKVVMSAHLSDADASTLGTLRNWLTLGRPYGVQRVELQGIHFDSASSGLLIFKIPLDVWANFPDNPAVRFIAFESNPNMQQHIAFPGPPIRPPDFKGFKPRPQLPRPDDTSGFLTETRRL